MGLLTLLDNLEHERRLFKIPLASLDEEQKGKYRKVIDKAAEENVLISDRIAGRISFLDEANSFLRDFFLLKGISSRSGREEMKHRFWNLEAVLGVNEIVITPRDESTSGWMDKDWFKSEYEELAKLAEDFTYKGRLKENAYYLGNSVVCGFVPGIFLYEVTDHWFVYTLATFYLLPIGVSTISGRSRVNELRNNAKFLDDLFDLLYDNKGQDIHLISQADVTQSNLYLRQGAKHLKGKYFDAALNKYLLSVELNPRNASAYAGLSQVYSERGDHASAKEAAKKAIWLNPFSVEARLVLYLAFITEQRPDLILKDFESLPTQLKEDKEMIDMRSRAFFIYRDQLKQQGREEDAAELFKKREEYVPLESLLRIEKELTK